MKILHIADYYGSVPGTFIDDLSSLTHEGLTQVFVFPVERPWQKSLLQNGSKVFVFKLQSLLDIASFLKLLKIVRAEKIDIIHTHYSRTANTFAAWMKLFYPRVKVVWHWRMPMGVEAALLEGNIQGKTLYLYKFKRFIGNIIYRVVDLFFVDAHITVSEGVANNLRQRGITNNRKLRVVLNGVDVKEFDPDKNNARREDFGLQKNDVVICDVAHFRQQKDHFTLLRAFATVLKKHPSAKLLLLGEGPLRSEIESYVEKLSLAQAVKILGARNDVPDVLAISDFSAITSLYEGFCFFAIESLAMRKPLVATDVCGLNEVITCGRDGFLVASGDDEAIAEKISFLIDNPQIIREMGLSGRQKVLENFTLKRWAEDIKKIYVSLYKSKDAACYSEKIKKYKFKLTEFIYHSKSIRYLWMWLLRIFSIREYFNIRKYIVTNSHGNSGKILIALSCRFTVFEHIKEIFFYLKDHKSFIPLPITTSKFFNLDRKQSLFDDFGNKYGLIYGQNYFSYIWLSAVCPRVLIETQRTTHGDFCKSAIKILYAHGLANLGFSKDFSYIKYIGKYDYLFLTGPLQKRAILYAQKLYGGKLPEMVEIGFLRGDRLLAKKKYFNKEEMFRKMNLENRFTLLFAPTWGEFSGTKEWIDKLVQVCFDLDINILIRLHPIMMRGRTSWETGGLDWNLKLKDIEEKYKRAHIVTDDDIDNYLLVSDAAVTDASSVGMEFMLLEKPVIFVPAPIFFKVYGKERPIAWIREGLEVKDVDELKRTLGDYLNGRSAQRIYSSEQIIYNPGRAINAIADFLDNLFKNK